MANRSSPIRAKPSLSMAASCSAAGPGAPMACGRRMCRLASSIPAPTATSTSAASWTAARFPDAVPTNPIQGGWLYATGGSSNSIQFNAGDVPHFSSTAGLYVEVFGQRGWESYLEPVTSIDYTTNTVHLGGSTWDPVGTGSRYFFFNAADQLNAPGEWYYDPVASTISYKPSDPSWSGGNAVGANLSQVFAINGASNITLGGLTINGSTNNGVGIDIVNSG